MDVLQNRRFVRHHFAQRWHYEWQKERTHDTSKVLSLPHKMTSKVSKVLCLPRKMQRIFSKRSKSIAPATPNDSWHVVKHVGMSRGTTWNEAVRRWKAPKVTPFAELTIGRAIWSSRGRLRTVANGCGRLRTVADGCGRLGNVWRTHINPQTPRVKREPLRPIREKQQFAGIRTQFQANPISYYPSINPINYKTHQYIHNDKHWQWLYTKQPAQPHLLAALRDRSWLAALRDRSWPLDGHVWTSLSNLFFNRIHMDKRLWLDPI